MSASANLLVAVLLVWGSFALFRWSIRRDRKMSEPETRSDPLLEPAPSVAGVLHGRALDEYVEDGLLQLQVFLAQSSRGSGRASHRPDGDA
jgi:hypothetical protein